MSTEFALAHAISWLPANVYNPIVWSSKALVAPMAGRTAGDQRPSREPDLGRVECRCVRLSHLVLHSTGPRSVGVRYLRNYSLINILELQKIVDRWLSIHAQR